jgi:hypothetical protein
MDQRALIRIGIAGPLFFAAASVLLTVAEHGYLTSHGWDPVGDSDVTWGSALAAGRSASTRCWRSWRSAPRRSRSPVSITGAPGRRAAARVLTLSAVLTCLAARPVDVPVPVHSWHGVVNEAALSLLVITTPLGMLLVARERGWSIRWVVAAIAVVGLTALAFQSIGVWTLYLYYAAWAAYLPALAL